MRFLTCNKLRNHNAFFLGLVCQHGATHHIAYGVDVSRGCLELVVYFNLSAVVKYNASRFGIKSVGIGPAPHRH